MGPAFALSWGRTRGLAALVAASLIVGFTLTQVTGGTAMILGACLLGLLPIAFFLSGSQLARGVTSAIALLALAAYTAAWIYVVRQFNADKTDGLPLSFFFLAALGGAALTPPLLAHWLSYIWRDWRSSTEQSPPS